MSLKSCFPRIHEVESEFGSLIRGLIKLQKQARKQGKKDTPGPGPGGNLTSFRAGMSVMTDALTEKQQEAIAAAIPAQSFGKPDDVAAATVFFASDESAYVTGETMHVNGGMIMI